MHPNADRLIDLEEGRPVPQWVVDHVRTCDDCRADVEALRRFGEAPEIPAEPDEPERLQEGWRRFRAAQGLPESYPAGEGRDDGDFLVDRHVLGIPGRGVVVAHIDRRAYCPIVRAVAKTLVDTMTHHGAPVGDLSISLMVPERTLFIRVRHGGRIEQDAALAWPDLERLWAFGHVVALGRHLAKTYHGAGMHQVAIRHRAGEPADGVQSCTRCGETLADHRGAMTSDGEPPRWWTPGSPVIRWRSMTRSETTPDPDAVDCGVEPS